MYLRIMNKLDVSCMKETIRKAIGNPAVSEKVFHRISDTIEVLDEAYGEGRKAFDMGGFVFLLTDTHSSEQVRKSILDCYSLSGTDSEYKETVCKESSRKIWSEELYLRGSDDAVVIIYAEKPEEKPTERQGD